MPLCAHGTEKGVGCIGCYQDGLRVRQSAPPPVFISEDLDELHQQLSEVVKRIDAILAKCRRGYDA